MSSAAIIFPHQLFAHHPAVDAQQNGAWLIEEGLMFNDSAYPIKMHQQKLQLHFASLAYYQELLEDKGVNATGVKYQGDSSEIASAMQQISRCGVALVHLLDPIDDWIKQRLLKQAKLNNLSLQWHKSPGFLNTQKLNQQYRESKSRWFMADFYKYQRTRFNILMDGDKPLGGEWSYDSDNRKKVPKKRLADIPKVKLASMTGYHEQAIKRIEIEFSHHPGDGKKVIYPVTHMQAERWLTTFFEQRFNEFGPFEDAIVAEHNWLWHSILTPMLNIGLLTPQQVISQALDYAKANHVEINSLEGFVRQIIGWREFMRATYNDLGVQMRTMNNWQHHRKIPVEFYTGETGIVPLDDVIKKVLATGYCHHIERLMVIGGFFFLCEFDPDEIYRWFMQMFVDSYDWVMVPNVYAMSQNADGGQITTKPYFSGSNYIIKMSHYKRGEWSKTWDALYWRWIFKHKNKLAKNHRWSMMCRQADIMDDSKKNEHIHIAEQFLKQLDIDKPA